MVGVRAAHRLQTRRCAITASSTFVGLLIRHNRSKASWAPATTARAAPGCVSSEE